MCLITSRGNSCSEYVPMCVCVCVEESGFGWEGGMGGGGIVLFFA